MGRRAGRHSPQFLGIKILQEDLGKALGSLEGYRELNRFKSTWDTFVAAHVWTGFLPLECQTE